MSEVLDSKLAAYQDLNHQVLALGDKVLGSMLNVGESYLPVSSYTEVRSDVPGGLTLTSNTLQTNNFDGNNIQLNREMTEVDGILVPISTGIYIQEVTPKGKKNRGIELLSRTIHSEQIGSAGLLSELFIIETIYNEPREPFKAVLSYATSMSGTGVIRSASERWTPELIRSRISVFARTYQSVNDEDVKACLDGVKRYSFSDESLDYEQVNRNANRIIKAAKSSTAVKHLLKRK